MATEKVDRPTPIKPDFARERARLLWQGYYGTVAKIEQKAVKRAPAVSVKIGRVLRAGETKQRYQAAMLGVKQPEKAPRRAVEKPHPRTYMKKKLGADRYRDFLGEKRGDPVATSILPRNEA